MHIGVATSTSSAATSSNKNTPSVRRVAVCLDGAEVTDLFFLIEVRASVLSVSLRLGDLVTPLIGAGMILEASRLMAMPLITFTVVYKIISYTLTYISEEVYLPKRGIVEVC